jgi:hypothetical protein
LTFASIRQNINPLHASDKSRIMRILTTLTIQKSSWGMAGMSHLRIRVLSPLPVVDRILSVGMGSVATSATVVGLLHKRLEREDTLIGLFTQKEEVKKKDTSVVLQGLVYRPATHRFFCAKEPFSDSPSVWRCERRFNPGFRRVQSYLSPLKRAPIFSDNLAALRL